MNRGDFHRIFISVSNILYAATSSIERESGTLASTLGQSTHMQRATLRRPLLPLACRRPHVISKGNPVRKAVPHGNRMPSFCATTATRKSHFQLNCPVTPSSTSGTTARFVCAPISSILSWMITPELRRGAKPSENLRRLASATRQPHRCPSQ